MKRVALLCWMAACGGSDGIVAGDAGPDASPQQPVADAAPPPVGGEARFDGVTAVRALPAPGGGALVLLETLQEQLLITVPQRRAVLLDDTLRTVRSFEPPEGWTMLDAAVHPSGDVTTLAVQFELGAPLPLHLLLSRHLADGSQVDAELPPKPLPDDVTVRFMSSMDRARIVARGEELYVAARWCGNDVSAYRYGFSGGAWSQRWETRVEPQTQLLVLGIIGGGFDNFHQGDSRLFVYLDLDGAGNAYVAVASQGGLVEEHDAAFGDHLLDLVEPEVDYGTAILTRVDADGTRRYASLIGYPGRNLRLTGMRVAGERALLVGRQRMSGEPDGWDAWIAAADVATGATAFARPVDVEHGDMFWDATALADGRIVAVGSTNYTQNPSGLSVSDERDALGVILDRDGQLLERLALPRDPDGRGDEASSVWRDELGRLVFAGMLDGPGTHAEVRSDGFVSVSAAQ